MTTLASDQSLTSATNDLLAAAATMDDSGLAALAEDLGSFAGVLAREPHLRRVLTEATVGDDVKSGLLDRLLSGKVDDRSLRLITATARHRWSGGRALISALHHLANTASFLQAERSGDLDEVEDQLFRFGRIVDGNGELAAILDDAATAPEGKIDLVRRLLAGKAHPLTLRLLIDLARDTRGRSFAYGVSALVSQAAARHDKVVAVATSAIALSQEQVSSLRSRLADIYRREVAVHVIVDPAVSGGLRVRVGDEVIDGSISQRLDDLRRGLAR